MICGILSKLCQWWISIGCQSVWCFGSEVFSSGVFQVFWCYMRIAYLSAGLLKVLQVVYGDLRYVTSLEKIQTQNTFEIFLKQTAEDVPFHKFSLYLNSRILEFILTSRTYMNKIFKTKFFITSVSRACLTVSKVQIYLKEFILTMISGFFIAKFLSHHVTSRSRVYLTGW